MNLLLRLLALAIFATGLTACVASYRYQGPRAAYYRTIPTPITVEEEVNTTTVVSDGKVIVE
jgi:hypothetical protein